jgi:hypothetical protein
LFPIHEVVFAGMLRSIAKISCSGKVAGPFKTERLKGN